MKISHFFFKSFFLISILPLFCTSAGYAKDEVTLNLEVSIAASCSIEWDGSSAGPEPAVVELDADGETVIDFMIDCNSPFEYSLESENGALVHTGGETVASNSDSILTEVGYKTVFQANLEDGDTSKINQECSSAYLDDTDGTTPACGDGVGFADSGTSVAIDEAASLAIRLDGSYAPPLLDGVPLLAGTFQDELTLTVGIRP